MPIDNDEWDSYLESQYEAAWDMEMEDELDYLDADGDDLYYDYVEEDYLNDLADREAHLDWRI